MEPSEMDPVDIMIDDLARQVAQKAFESASWKARAIAAETALAKVSEGDETEDDG